MNKWEINSPEILCDVLSIDPSLASSYASHLLGGKTLPISYTNFFSFQTSITSAAAVSIPPDQRLQSALLGLFDLHQQR